MRGSLDDPIRNMEPRWRGWTKPGPLPDAEAMRSIALEPGETLDALCGHWRIFQLERGHRYSTDDLLCAWYASSHAPSARRVLDLGSGLGCVALVIAWRLAGARLIGVEAQAESVRLARKSARYNGVADRYEPRLGDFRHEALRPEERFDLVTGSPPYFPLGSGPTPAHPQKRACRFELRGAIDDYAACAARHLAPGGWFVCVFPIEPAHQAARVEAAAEAAGLAIVRRRPVALRELDGALLGLFAMQRAADLPASMRGGGWCEPTLVVRDRDRAIHAEYAAVKLSLGFPP